MLANICHSNSYVGAESIIPAQGSGADFAPRFLCHTLFQYCVGFPDYENRN